jgi:hypothetical protein
MVVVACLTNAVHQFMFGHPSDWNVNTEYGVLGSRGRTAIKSHQLYIVIENPRVNASCQFRRTKGDCCPAVKLSRNTISLVAVVLWVIGRNDADITSTRHIH